jgi:universal stress protein A
VFKHILCPVDGSQCSLQALDLAAGLAAEQQAEFTICGVLDPSQAAAMAFGDPAMSAACYDALEEEAKQLLSDAAAREERTIPATTAMLYGQTIPAILSFVSANACDLIVMGSHGRSGIQRALVGSVAEGVLRHANVPVLIVRLSGRRDKAQHTEAASAVTPT